MPNRLAQSHSPYLLQHAHNPVDWYEWNDDALQKAKTEDKPIIVSIGYSACHWCHVMERESFENETLAKIMNEHFICIKVDREERPDIDQIYMDAVQNMGLRGGWPLNVFLDSEAKPFYGGTYFPPQNWQNLLLQVSQAYKNHRDEIEKSALSFKESLNRTETEKYGLHAIEAKIETQDLNHYFEIFSKSFDKEWGGMNRAPKFPMPSNYSFLLKLGHITNNNEAKNHAIFTLKKMALGGIYDQAGGGFARYSTDGQWFLPHFEKMLYDNGQLISLYSEAYLQSKEPLFKRVVYQTIEFVKRELTNEKGAFYSALDADSEGEEGKFYVWNSKELERILSADYELFKAFYQMNDEGNWEHGNNILWSLETIEVFTEKLGLNKQEFEQKINHWHQILLTERAKRVRPGLDYKIITSWNGLMLNGLVDAYRVFDEETFLKIALQNAEYIVANHLKSSKNGTYLHHTEKDGKEAILGFLEDYSFIIQAFTNLYQATFDEKWLTISNELIKYVLGAFTDKNEAFLYFTDSKSESLIARKKEIFDNVIPASNSQMAINLYTLGKILDNEDYISLAELMFAKMKKMLGTDPGYLANWGVLATLFVSPTKEIVISGKNALSFRAALDKVYFPNKILVGTTEKSSGKLSLLSGREPQNETLIYICENKTCQLPLNAVKDAIQLLNE